MGFLDLLFGGGSSNNNVKEYLEKGAAIIDVRTPAEFNGGHVKGAKNIPLDQLNGKIAEIKKWNKPVIAYCASGNRSGMATNTLKSNGIDCINGGGFYAMKSMV